MRTSSFYKLTDRERSIVSDFICQAFIFADYFDVRDRYSLANDEYADIVMEKMTEWEQSEEFDLDMPRCESIELFCENNSDKWNEELRTDYHWRCV